MTIDAIASAIYNHVNTGLAGISSNPKISIEQLRDEVVAEKNKLIREYLLKGVLRLDELYLAINCIEVTCGDMAKCSCKNISGKQALHFEIPPIIYLPGLDTIKFIGSVDKAVSYKVYTDHSYKFHTYKRHGNQKPFVYLDTTINANGNMDGYIFNLPYVKYITVVALFQDPRRLLEWDCCSDSDVYLDCGIISDDIIQRLTTKYIT